MKRRKEGNTEQQELEHIRKDIRHNERRIDDLQTSLAKVLQGLVDAETREERLAAVEMADVLPTVRVHRRSSA
jgi:chromosome segregation ATPase